MTKEEDLLIILPESTTPTMRILKSSKASGYKTYEEIWKGTGLTGEPLVDDHRLETDDVLSMFVRQDVEGSEGKRAVVVLDFEL